jgi:threonine dehydratase
MPDGRLSALHAADVWLKAEHQQHTGSFKARGALNKLLGLSAEQRARGVVTASSGNHGAGVAWAGRTLGIPVTVFVPQSASPAKLDRIRGYGADVQLFGTDGLDTELHARDAAARNGRAYVSPYNDWDVVAGQGTIAVEMLEQMGTLDAVVVAVGGGGLIGGIAAYLKSRLPDVRVIGAQPRNSAVMFNSVRAGHIVLEESLPTLSDGTAGGVESDAITFELCRTLVDDWVLVDEDEIATAMRDFMTARAERIEGAAGVALAALTRQAGSLRGQRINVVVCGGNVSDDALQRSGIAPPLRVI